MLIGVLLVLAACGTPAPTTTTPVPTTPPATPPPTPPEPPTLATPPVTPPTIPPPATPATSTQPAPKAALIEIISDEDANLAIGGYGGGFQPRIITVALGAMVTLNNTDGKEHTVVSKDGLFDKHLEYADSFSYTFTQRGSFAYYCRLYDSMDGKIIVE